MPTIAIILNQAAGSESGVDSGRIVDPLRAAGFEVSVEIARDGAQIAAAAKRAVAGKADMVVAGGGDGTVNCVASHILGSACAMGVLPLGTLNHFAKDLGIPLDLDAAVRNLIDGSARKVDVAEVNGKVFINNAGIGIYPDIVKVREEQQRRFGRSKWAAFFWACVASARRFPFLDVELETNEVRLPRRTPFVFVGNNQYTIDGLDVGRRKRLDAGTMSLYVAQRTGRIGLVGFAFRALFGRLRQARDFDAIVCETVQIRTRRRNIRVSTDGEVTMMRTPLRFRTRPGALTVTAPAATEVVQQGPAAAAA